MTAKEYLSRTYRINEEIESKQRQLDNLYGLKAVSYGDKIGSTAINSAENRMVKIADLIRKLEAEKDKLIDVLVDIHGKINLIENADERLLLTLRFVEFNRFETIAVMMKYSQAQIYRIYRDALKNFSKLIVNDSE